MLFLRLLICLSSAGSLARSEVRPGRPAHRNAPDGVGSRRPGRRHLRASRPRRVFRTADSRWTPDVATLGDTPASEGRRVRARTDWGGGHLHGTPLTRQMCRRRRRRLPPDCLLTRERGRSDGRAAGLTDGAICVQRLDDSLNSAIHTRYRSSRRSSSMHEPRGPPLEVVLSLSLDPTRTGPSRRRVGLRRPRPPFAPLTRRRRERPSKPEEKKCGSVAEEPHGGEGRQS